MKINAEQKRIIDEITDFIMTSTDTDILILSAFVAGLQAGHKRKSTNTADFQPHSSSYD